MGRIREICESGATVFFVSHSSYIIAELCDQAIWIDEGRVKSVGNAKNVVKAYEFECWQRVEQSVVQRNSSEGSEQKPTTPISEPLSPTDQVLATGKYQIGGEELRIIKVDLEDTEGQCVLFTADQRIVVKIAWEGRVKDEQIWVGLTIGNSSKAIICSYESWTDDCYLSRASLSRGEGVVSVSIPHLHLGPGDYDLSVSISRYSQPWTKECILHRIEKACSFHVKRRQLIPSRIYDPVFEFSESSLTQ